VELHLKEYDLFPEKKKEKEKEVSKIKIMFRPSHPAHA
jgi:hypothetical protein